MNAWVSALKGQRKLAQGKAGFGRSLGSRRNNDFDPVGVVGTVPNFRLPYRERIAARDRIPRFHLGLISLCRSATSTSEFNCQRAPNTNEPNGPRAKRIARIVGFPDTNLRETLNFPLLA